MVLCWALCGLMPDNIHREVYTISEVRQEVDLGMADTIEEEDRWADDAEVHKILMEFIKNNRELLMRIGKL